MPGLVGQILSKPEYMGDTVNFRTHKESYKDKSTVPNPKEDWLIFEDTHEAIVDREIWALAQKLRKTPKRIDTIGVANPLTGLWYCPTAVRRCIVTVSEAAQKIILTVRISLIVLLTRWCIRSMPKPAVVTISRQNPCGF